MGGGEKLILATQQESERSNEATAKGLVEALKLLWILMVVILLNPWYCWWLKSHSQPLFGWCWNPINNGRNYQPQLVLDFWTINSSIGLLEPWLWRHKSSLKNNRGRSSSWERHDWNWSQRWCDTYAASNVEQPRGTEAFRTTTIRSHKARKGCGGFGFSSLEGWCSLQVERSEVKVQLELMK